LKAALKKHEFGGMEMGLEMTFNFIARYSKEFVTSKDLL
jgi:hypothetical protein